MRYKKKLHVKIKAEPGEIQSSKSLFKEENYRYAIIAFNLSVFMFVSTDFKHIETHKINARTSI